MIAWEQGLPKNGACLPLFLCLLLWHSARGYTANSNSALRFELSFLILPMVLHRDTEGIIAIEHCYVARGLARQESACAISYHGSSAITRAIHKGSIDFWRLSRAVAYFSRYAVTLPSIGAKKLELHLASRATR